MRLVTLPGITLTVRNFSAVAAMSSTRSKLGREEIKWQELLQHFRSVQAKHEKARRLAIGAEISPLSELLASDQSSLQSNTPPPPARPPMRRKVTGVDPQMRPPSRTGGLLSPLNPRSRQNGISPLLPPSPPVSGGLSVQQKPKRTPSLNTRK